MEEKKTRGRKIGGKLKKTCEFLGVRYDVFKGSFLHKEMYYQAKKKIFEDLGFETKLQKRVNLKVKVEGKFVRSPKVYLMHKSGDKKRVPPINSNKKFHRPNASYETRNCFCDFVLEYVNGRITYKKLLQLSKKMYVRVIK